MALTECPNCEQWYPGLKCPLCGFTPASLEPMDPGPLPKDNARWLCRNRPENGHPCSIPGCDHPGSYSYTANHPDERPTREQVQALIRELAAKLGARS